MRGSGNAGMSLTEAGVQTLSKPLVVQALNERGACIDSRTKQKVAELRDLLIANLDPAVPVVDAAC